MRQAGEREIDILLWDVDQRTADAYLVADNRFGELSHPDADRRAELLAGFGDEDFAALGFLTADVEKLLSGPDPIEVQEIGRASCRERVYGTV